MMKKTRWKLNRTHKNYKEKDTVNPYRKLEDVLKPVRLSKETMAPVRLSEEIMAPVRLSEEIMAPIRLSEEILKPIRLSEEIMAPIRLSEEILKPIRLSEEIMAPIRLSEEIMAPIRLSEEIMAPIRLSEEILKPIRLSEEILKPIRLSEEILKPHRVNLTALSASLNKMPNTYIIEEDKTASRQVNKTTAVIKLESNDSVPMDSLASTLSPMDIINDLTIDEVFSFYNHLIKYPLLGLKHEVGVKIFNELRNQSLVSIEGINLFRARERNCIERPLPFNELEMFEAPYGISGQGRFNVNGQGELYTCSNKDIALKEIGATNSKDKKYEVIEWKLIREVKMLDLTNKDSELVKFCLFKKVSNNSQEYLLPNYLAQCAKFHGINGIKVNSTIDDSQSNYVFFDFEKKWFKITDLKFNVKP